MKAIVVMMLSLALNPFKAPYNNYMENVREDYEKQGYETFVETNDIGFDVVWAIN